MKTSGRAENRRVDQVINKREYVVYAIRACTGAGWTEEKKIDPIEIRQLKISITTLGDDIETTSDCEISRRFRVRHFDGVVSGTIAERKEISCNTRGRVLGDPSEFIRPVRKPRPGSAGYYYNEHPGRNHVDIFFLVFFFGKFSYRRD